MSKYADVQEVRKVLSSFVEKHRMYVYIKGEKQYVEVFPKDIQVDEEEDIVINVNNTGNEDNLNTAESQNG